MKRFGIISTLIVSITVFFSLSFDSPEDQFIMNLAKKLKIFNEKYPQEKVYLHIDKSIYKPSDNLWFKAYISEGLNNMPSFSSEKLYVRLINQSGETVYNDIFIITHGKAIGDFSIPPTLEDGKYYLVAYTSWMTNGKVNDLFSKEILVKRSAIPRTLMTLELNKHYYIAYDDVNAKLKITNQKEIKAEGMTFKYYVFLGKKSLFKGSGKTDNEGIGKIVFKLPEIKQGEDINLEITTKYNKKTEKLETIIPVITQDFIDLQFFPEGGNMVNNLESKIAFKAIDKYGQAFDFEGTIFDKNDQPIQNIKSYYKGMGAFDLKPIDGIDYKVKISKPEGISQTFQLPKSEPDGMVLSFEQGDKDNLYFKLNSTRKYAERVNILAQVRGEIYFAAMSTIKEQLDFKIPLKGFPIGIAQITIFDGYGKPKAERLIFVNKERKIHIAVKSDKLNFGKREKVKIKINVKDETGNPMPANLSLSATDDLFVPENIDNSTLLSSFLLKSDLKGKIETPEYYFQDNLESELALNYLLMTHGWRRFAWEEIQKMDTIQAIGYSNKDGYSGIVVNSKGETVKKAKIKVVNTINWNMVTTFSDENGKFNIPFSEYGAPDKYLNISAYDPLTSKQFKIIQDNSFHSAIDNYSRTDLFKQYREGLKLNNYFKFSILNPEVYDVNPNEVKVEKGKIVEVPNAKRKIDYSSKTSVLEIVREMKYFDMVGNKIIFQGNHNSFMAQQGALIVLDGMMLGDDASTLDHISPATIDNVFISNNVVDVQKYSGLYCNGLIEITTKRGPDLSKIAKPEPTIPIDKSFNGFTPPREFYSPKYTSKEEVDIPKPDFRTTLYWNPEILVDKTGEAEVSFYNGDIKSKVKVLVQGITVNGFVGAKSIDFVVE